jgi:hypothetical protein
MEDLSLEHRVVYDLIKSAGKITQLQIARSEKWLGCHPTHEAYGDKKETTLRQVRQIIRDLRLKHGVLILSDNTGYWIMKDRTEAIEYISRIEKVAKAQAKAWFETYAAMKKNFGISSDYFNQQGKLFE